MTRSSDPQHWNGFAERRFLDCFYLPESFIPRPNKTFEMPRPKVSELSRRRVAKACIYCQASKSKCDGLKPCASCVKRRRTSECAYSTYERSYGLHRRRKAKPHPVVDCPSSLQQHSMDSPLAENTRHSTKLHQPRPMPMPSTEILIPKLSGNIYDTRGRVGKSIWDRKVYQIM